MARMFPRTLFDADVKSEAERKAFNALRDGLGDDWDVFHSASLIVRDRRAGAEDDETDFVLCHPGRGIIALEVKGGGIECRHGEWFRIEGGKQVRTRDPFGVALDHKHNLRRKIEALDGWGDAALRFCSAVWFPDITVHELVLAPDAPSELILDRHDLADPAPAVERVVAFQAGREDGRRAPGPKGAQMLRDLLAPEVSIRVPMAAAFSDEEEQLVHLTYEQAALLRQLGRNRRMAIHGCAGSGKTMLAVERAKRLAEDGKDVLFVCFNRGLRDYLAERERRSGIAFFTFHSLCVHAAKKAKVALTEHEGTPPQSYWDDELPAALMAAMDDGGAYDAVFVDEAQDLHDDWLDALESTLRDPDVGFLWLFLDDNQRIYDQTLTVPKDFLRWDLTVNCRNTQAIHKEVMKLYEGEIRPEVRGPAGRDVELLRSDDQPRTVAGVLERLCGREEVLPQDVVVLSSHAAAKSEVASRGKAGRFTFTDKRGQLGPNVFFSSIRGFKGLESPVVVLCELEDLDDATRDQQLYVALSRAKNHCVIVAPA